MSVPADTPDVLALEARIAALEVRTTSLEAESVRLADDLSTCRAINALDAELCAIRDRMSDDPIGGGGE